MTTHKYIITLIIPTKNRPDDLRICLRAVVQSTRRPDEVIVVDDGGNYDCAALLREQLAASGIAHRLLRHPQSLGHARARTTGINAATGNLIFFLDDDCEVLPDYFAVLEAVYCDDVDGRVAGVEGYIIGSRPGAGWRESFRRLFLLNYVDQRGRMLLSGFPVQCCEEHDRVETEILCGACSFRRSVYNEFSYNAMFAGWSYDDCEFSNRVAKRYRLVHQPAARMYHHVSGVARNNFLRYLREPWMHYETWKNCVPLTPRSVLAFAWSHCGLLLDSLLAYRSVRRPLGYVMGTAYMGWRMLLDAAARLTAGRCR